MRIPIDMSKYKRQGSSPMPWSDIEKQYADLKLRGWEIDPVLELVRHIIATKLSDRLFAYTSVAKLIVGIYDPMEWNREALHIEFDQQQQTWSFKYHPKPGEPIEFERTYAADKGIEKFDNFIGMMKW